MSRPTEVLGWATTLANDVTSGQPNRVEPDAGMKAAGWGFNAKPAKGHMNWLLYALSNWVFYLKEYVDQAVYAGAAPIFSGITATENLAVTANSGSGSLLAKANVLIKDLSNVTKMTLNNITGYLTAVRGIFTASMSSTQVYADNITSLADFGAGNLTLGSPVVSEQTLALSGKVTMSNAATSIRGSDTGITGAELETLSAGPTSDANGLHTHNTSGYLGFNDTVTVLGSGDNYGLDIGAGGKNLQNSLITVSGKSFTLPATGVYKLNADLGFASSADDVKDVDFELILSGTEAGLGHKSTLSISQEQGLKRTLSLNIIFSAAASDTGYLKVNYPTVQYTYLHLTMARIA